MIFIVGLLISTFGNLNVAFCQSRGGSGYQLTIYVDEGNDKGEITGHTFIGLSDGKNTEYSGWNTGGVEDSAHLESAYISKCKWDAKKTYDITKAGYEKALQEINKWDTDGKDYDLDHHCGHFANAVAQAAGISLPFKYFQFFTTRPQLFGDFLRENDGQAAASVFQVNSYENTGLSIKRGDMLSFRASGNVSFGPSVGFAGPEGKTHFIMLILPVEIDTNYNLFPDEAHGSLIGRIKTPGASALADWFYIGEGGETTAEQTGFLELNVNDKNPKDNKGKFEVEVKICKAQ